MQGSRAYIGRLAKARAKFGFKLSFGQSSSYGGSLRESFLVKVNASGDPVPSSETDSIENEAVGPGKGDPFGHFRGVISSLPPVVFVVSIIILTFSVIYRKKDYFFSVRLLG